MSAYTQAVLIIFIVIERYPGKNFMNNKMIFRLLNAAILLGILFVAFLFVISVWQSERAEENFSNVELSLKIKDELQDLQIKAIKVQTTTRGYVISGNRGFVDSFPIARAYFSSHLSNLRTLTHWNPSEAAAIDSFEAYINNRLELSAQIISFIDKGKKSDAERIVASEWGKMINSNIVKYGQQLEDINQLKLEKSEDLSRGQIHFLNLILYFGIFVFLLLTVFFLVTIWRNIKLSKQRTEVINDLVGAGPDAMLILNGEGKIINMSTRGENMFGYKLFELKGKPLAKILDIPVEDYEVYTLAGDSEFYFSTEREVRASRKDGSAFTAEIYITPLHGRKEYSFAISVRDISKRKAAYRQLEMLSRQINASTDAIYIVDKKRQITSWNSGAENLYGYSKAEALGQDPVTIFKIDVSDESVKKVSNWLKTNQHWSGETVEQTKNGDTIYTFTSITLIQDEEGISDGYISVSYNITDQRKLRQELNYLARIVEQTSDAVLSTGMEGVIISWNKGAENLFGYTKQEAIGKTALQLGILKLSAEEMEEIYKELHTKGKWHAEKTYFHKDGHHFIGEVTGNKMVDEKGLPITRAYIVKDISRRKEYEDQLRQYNEQLEERVRLRTEEIARTEKRYRNLFDNNPLPMMLLDIQTSQCIDVNKMAIEKYGYTKEEFLKLKANDLRPAEQKEYFLQRYEDMFQSSAINRGFWQHQKKNGEVFPIEYVAHRIKIDNRHAWLLMIIDITDRKQAEEKLIASEKKFRTLIENNTDIISLMDRDFNVIYRSPSAFRFTGWTDGEMLGTNGAGKVHSDDQKETLDLIDTLMKNPGVSLPLKFRHRHKSGHYIWLEGVIVNWLHVDAVNAIVFNFRDVTERVKAGEKILANEKRFRESLDHMIEGVQIVGFDWKYIYVNDSMMKQSGLKKDAIIGNAVMELFPQIEGTELQSGFERCFKERVSVQLENCFVYPNGKTAWFDLSIQPVPEGIFVLTVDITERKNAESKLNEERLRIKTLSDNLPGLIIFQFICEHKVCRFTHISQEAERLTGHDTSAILKSADLFFSRVSKNDLERLLSSIQHPDVNGNIVLEEIVFHSANDGTRHLKYVACPRMGVSSEKIWDGFYIDITEQKSAERKIMVMNERLEGLVTQRTAQLTKTNEELEAFSYSVSHDLRAPLRIINGFTEIFEEEYANQLDEEAKRLTKVIKQNTQRMGQLIDDLLAFFRMGRHEIKKINFDTNELVREVITGVDCHHPTEIVWKIDSLLSTFGDYVTIRQVWVNLVSNAVKYSSANPGPVIEIGSYNEHYETVYYIKDNGVGFDQKYAEKLFKVFQRLHSNQDFEGTGVGLAVVHRIISRHNGRVWATGKSGEGATFFFTLPDDINFVEHFEGSVDS